MARRLVGFNKLFTVKRRRRTFTASGSVEEDEAVILAKDVPGAIQPHVLSNLPPPPERTRQGGLVRVDEYRLWLGDPSSSVDVQLDDLLEEQDTDPVRVYRVLAVLDAAGRGHHQYLRVESYSQESAAWEDAEGEPP